jgi:hypothetical protein
MHDMNYHIDVVNQQPLCCLLSFAFIGHFSTFGLYLIFNEIGNGWYSIKGEEKKYRIKDTYTKEFWLPVLANKEFREYIETNYRISNSSLTQDLGMDDIDEEYTAAGA